MGKKHMSILIFLAVLSVLVGVHELGHLGVAKFFNVYVKSFSLGFGPTLVKKQIGETTYKISAIPLGGYVSMAGENPEAEEEANIPQERLLSSKKPWQKLLIVLAGPGMNVVFAFLAMPFVFMLGAPQMASDDPKSIKADQMTIEQVLPGSPAEKAGLLAGDRLVSVNGKEIKTYQDIVEWIGKHPNESVAITFVRLVDNKATVQSTTIHVEQNKHDPKAGVIGVQFKFHVEYPKFGPVDSVKMGTKSTVEMIGLMSKGLSKLVTGSIPTKQAVSGPIEIAVMVNSAAQVGLSTLLFFAILLSLNLAILNMFPLLPLDGGHALFFALEMVGITVSLKVKQIVGTVGTILLLALMVWATSNDIAKYFK